MAEAFFCSLQSGRSLPIFTHLFTKDSKIISGIFVFTWNVMVSICHDQGLFSHSHLEVPSICMFHSVVPCCFHLNLWCLLSAFRRKSWVFSLLSWKDRKALNSTFVAIYSTSIHFSNLQSTIYHTNGSRSPLQCFWYTVLFITYACTS